MKHEIGVLVKSGTFRAAARKQNHPQLNNQDDAQGFLCTVWGVGPMFATDLKKEVKETMTSISALRRSKDKLGARYPNADLGQTTVGRASHSITDRRIIRARHSVAEFFLPVTGK